MASSETISALLANGFFGKESTQLAQQAVTREVTKLGLKVETMIAANPLNQANHHAAAKLSELGETLHTILATNTLASSPKPSF